MGVSRQLGVAAAVKGRCARLMAAGLLCVWSACHASAQLPLLSNPITRSRSGQFSIQTPPHAAPDAFLLTNRSLVHLDPAVLAVSCEHIKELLWRELEMKGPWGSKVFITLYPALTPNDNALLRSERFKNGWEYQMYVPEMVERERCARAVIQVLLLDVANRNAGTRSAEVPTWMVEGFSRQLQAAYGAQLILSSPESRGGVRPMSHSFADGRRLDPLTRAHALLSASPALTFQDLSWPDPARLAGEAGEVYRSAAQLFVNRLLKLPNGPACLRGMLTGLPDHYNWQFAFLAAFHSHFERPLDVEKWWAIQLAEFTGRRLDRTWAADSSLRKLEQAVRSGIQVRTAPNELPLHAEAALQNVVRDWDRATQTPVIQGKLAELDLLRYNVAPEVVPLVDDYRKTLANYLQKRDKPGLLTLPFRKQAAQRHNVEETVARLNALDAHRAGLLRLNPRALSSSQSLLSQNSGSTLTNSLVGFSPLPAPSRSAR